jgi:hypothetical protein
LAKKALSLTVKDFAAELSLKCQPDVLVVRRTPR